MADHYTYKHIDCDIEYETSTRKSDGLLRFAADRRTLMFVAIYFALTVAVWFWNPAGWLVPVLMFVLASSSWQCAVITHNTIHTPIFHKRRHNKLMQIVLTLTYGHPVSSFVPGHNLSHHKFTQTPRDVMRTYKSRSQWNLVNMLTFMPRVAIAVFKGEQAFFKATKATHKTWHRQLRIEAVILIGLTIGLFIVDWRRALLYWYVPHLVAAWGIISVNYLQHDGCDPEHDYNHSRNFTGAVFGFLTVENGFHGMHHIRPNLHWSLLREAHAKLVHPHIHPNLEEPSLLVYLLKTFVWPGRRKRFDGQPYELPEKWEDENWVPTPDGPRVDFSMGAEAGV